jgi:hypothetical protein
MLRFSVYTKRLPTSAGGRLAPVLFWMEIKENPAVRVSAIFCALALAALFC